MQKEFEKKQSAEDKLLKKVRIKFVSVVFILIIILILT